MKLRMVVNGNMIMMFATVKRIAGQPSVILPEMHIQRCQISVHSIPHGVPRSPININMHGMSEP
tara:strand:+ start:8787 stop:8978 length:192 start_codon:yes stop_codon:yes gene_type:complete